MSKTVHSVKLQAYDAVDLDRVSYSNGDVVYDVTNQTIRVMDGATAGGFKIASQPWVTTALATPLLTPQSIAPSSPNAGQLAVSDGIGWNPSSDGLQHLMIYLNGSWVQIA
jgi:hypothetical protein